MSTDTSPDCSVPRSVTVSGTSMHPIIKNRQKLTIFFDFYQCNPISRGDTVLLEAGGRFYVKAVRALPGDRFCLERDSAGYSLYVNGHRAATSLGIPYSLPEAKARMLLLYEKDYKGVIPKDAYLVLGNQPEGSIDATQYGLVSKENIKGRVVIQPLSINNDIQ